MILQCQTDAIADLKLLAEHQQHGVIIAGNPGTGKTYLARQYSKFLRVSDFYTVNPAVSDLKTTIESCIADENPIVICIENLDQGVVQAAYPLLKSIEECPGYVYIVVTCNNVAAIPDTIPSRCAMISINPPTEADLELYSRSIDGVVYDFVHKHQIWSVVQSFNDVGIVLKFTADHLNYFNNIPNILQGKDSVSSITWKLQHFNDNSETPIILVVRYLMNFVQGYHKKVCIDCLNDLADNRISKNAILSKLVFELKYVR